MDEQEEILINSMYEMLKLKGTEAREALATDNTRTLDWGPNVSINKEKQKVERLQYKAQTTKAKQDGYLKEFSAFNKYMEGDKGSFYNPGGTSGWTVGEGIDIGHISRDRAIELGMPNQLITTADKYKAWGAKGKKVPRAVQKMQMDIDSEEWQNFGMNIAKTKLPLMEQLGAQNPQLSTRSIVALAQVDHWTGGLYNRTREASKLNRSTISLKTGGKQTHLTKDLQNPMADLLESGGATDGAVRDVLSLTQRSYGTKRPLNSNTLDRYMSFLDTGEYL